VNERDKKRGTPLHKKKEYLVWSSLSFQAIVIQQLDE